MPFGATWTPPAEFEEYQLLRLLGRGSMGEVHLARDVLLDRLVAVKFVAIEPDAFTRERFFTEARALARLQHPNVAVIHRVGELRGRPYLVSEFVRGVPLNELARPLPWDRARQIGLGLARGLAAAHRMRVLHRDLKPANAILSEADEPKLIDFGLAKLLDQQGAAEPEGARPTLQRSADATLSLPGARPEAAAVVRDKGSGGPLLGTPRYMAPEIWRGEAPSRQSDVYALGVILFELCAGAAPFGGLGTGELADQVPHRDAPRLRERAPFADEKFAALVDRCLARDPAARFQSADALREALDQLERPPAIEVRSLANPYRGLLAFEAEHEGLFRGRGVETRAVLERLRADPFLLVAGDSGVGKSSLCRAAVLPRVGQGALGGVWETVTLVPGRHPLGSIAAGLCGPLGVDEARLEAALRADPAELARALRRRAVGTLVFVDQLEELLTAAEPAEAALARAVLSGLVVRSSRVRLLATARSDYLTRLAALPGLGEELGASIFILRPLTAEAIREVVVAPAASFGVRFETEASIEALVEAGARASGGLPLLEFALSELWAVREVERGVIPAAALQKVGGVEGALARHADGVLEQLLPSQKEAARRILTRLVSPEGTRLRRAAEALAGPPGTGADTERALDALVRARLLVARRSDQSQTSSFELAHEALVSGWETLRGWLFHDAEARARRHRLERAATEWERLGRPAEGLLAGPALFEMRPLDLTALAAREAMFLERSRAVARRRRAGRWAAALVLPLALVLAVGGARWKARGDLRAQVSRLAGEASVSHALAARSVAELERARALAFAAFDGGDWPLGEQHWATALEREQEARRHFQLATRGLESALSLEGSWPKLRSQVAELALARFRFGELLMDASERDQAMDRVRLYDDEGPLAAQLTTPARLLVTPNVPATLSVARYVSRHGRLVLTDEVPLTPAAETALEAGSYLLKAQAPGRAPVALPLLLQRGREVSVDLELIASAQVPEGFVHVPAGEFLTGSNEGEDSRRGFFNAAPLHLARTGAYLIARHEVTFADWIAYLEALPAAERERRLPRSSTARNALNLRRVGSNDWALEFQPTTFLHRVRRGEKVRYRERDRRSEQDWLRFPVSGVSFHDAEAYAGWLDRTGQVPGARLCDELEWERASRGADGRRFSAGDRLDLDDANRDLTYGRRPLAFGPDEVGAHPGSRSPLGIDDAVGNVWEWVRSRARADEAVYRGGSWYHGELTCRLFNREVGAPTVRDPLMGVRLCATVGPSTDSRFSRE